ncbi:MAG: hypothetical protein OXC40_01450, partial [Proteobacteria bacterium]|nr:hypothetical protein [Pseudomonadota bacterium]
TVVSVVICVMIPVMALFGFTNKADAALLEQEASTDALIQQDWVMIAQSSNKVSSRRSTRSKRAAKYGNKKTQNRREIITKEKSFKMSKGRKNTVIDFEETDITGQRRDPGVSFVRSALTEEGGEFVQIRKKWHDAMVKSTQLVD